MKKLLFIFCSIIALQVAVAAAEDPVWMVTEGSDITNIAIHPNSRVIAVGGYMGYVSIRDINTGAKIAQIEKGDFNTDFFTKFSKTGKYLVYGGNYGFRIADGNTYDSVMTVLTGGFSGPFGLAFSPNENQIAAGYTNNITIYDIMTKQVVRRIEKIAPPDIKGQFPDIRNVEYSPDGTHLAFTMTDNKLRIYNLIQDKMDTTISYKYAGRVKYSHNGRKLAVNAGSGNTDAIILNSTTNVIEQTIDGITLSVTGMAFSPDDKYMAFSHADYPKTIDVWEEITKNKIHTIQVDPLDPFFTLDASSDGKYLATSIGDGLYLFRSPWTTTVYEPSYVQNTRVSPNPSNNSFLLEFTVLKPMNIKISLYDMAGELVKNAFSGQLNEGAQSLNISVNGIAPGAYLMKAESEMLLFTEKVMVGE